jgi:hypothetical protein
MASEGEAMTCPVCGKGEREQQVAPDGYMASAVPVIVSHLACVERLEADKTAMRGTITSQTNIINMGFGSNYDRAEQPETRSCPTCDFTDDPEKGTDCICDIYRLHVRGWGWEKAFYCSRWTARAEEGTP